MRRCAREFVAAYLVACCCCGCARDSRPAAPVSACSRTIPPVGEPRDRDAERVSQFNDLKPGVEECPEPIGGASDSRLETYNRFVERALGLPPDADVVLALRISPSFQHERALSLRRASDGRYVLRSTRLREDVWGKMMTNIQAQQGAVVHLDERSQARGLADVQVTREVRERFVDSSTAELLLALWNSALQREQIVDVSDTMSITTDGTL